MWTASATWVIRPAPAGRLSRSRRYVRLRNHYVHQRNGGADRRSEVPRIMANPFVYGEVVPPASFVDREIELDRLTADLLAGQKIFLISPRRYGKSSLVRQALRRRGAGRRADGRRHGQQLQLVRRVPRGLRAGAARRSRRGSTARAPGCATCSAASGPEVRVEPDERGGSQLALSFPSIRTDKDVSRLAQEVFALPGRIAEARHRRLAVALDEFQAIGSFDGGNVEHALRAAVQQQRQVGYVFSGSEPSLMERMLGRTRPFYKAGSGDAAPEDSGRPLRRLHRGALPRDEAAPRAGARRLDRRARRQPALRRAAPRARGLGRCARREDGGARGSCTTR